MSTVPTPPRAVAGAKAVGDRKNPRNIAAKAADVSAGAADGEVFVPQRQITAARVGIARATTEPPASGPSVPLAPSVTETVSARRSPPSATTPTDVAAAAASPPTHHPRSTSTQKRAASNERLQQQRTERMLPFYLASALPPATVDWARTLFDMYNEEAAALEVALTTHNRKGAPLAAAGGRLGDQPVSATTAQGNDKMSARTLARVFEDLGVPLSEGEARRLIFDLQQRQVAPPSSISGPSARRHSGEEAATVNEGRSVGVAADPATTASVAASGTAPSRADARRMTTSTTSRTSRAASTTGGVVATSSPSSAIAGAAIAPPTGDATTVVATKAQEQQQHGAVSLGFDLFLHVVQLPLSARPREELAALWRALDRDADGCLSAEDVAGAWDAHAARYAVVIEPPTTATQQPQEKQPNHGKRLEATNPGASTRLLGRSTSSTVAASPTSTGELATPSPQMALLSMPMTAGSSGAAANGHHALLDAATRDLAGAPLTIGPKVVTGADSSAAANNRRGRRFPPLGRGQILGLLGQLDADGDGSVSAADLAVSLGHAAL